MKFQQLLTQSMTISIGKSVKRNTISREIKIQLVLILMPFHQLIDSI